MPVVSLGSGLWIWAHPEKSLLEPIFEVYHMPRIVRLSAFAVLSLALLPLGLSGCGQQPADGAHIQVDEVERKQAIDKMRAFMDTRKMPVPKVGRGLR
jgi:hypothetical protein